MERFDALEVSLEVIRELRKPIQSLRSRDPKLYDQIRRAASSISLNLAEGSARNGRDRTQHFRIAAGSVSELRAALRVAAAWGDLDSPHVVGVVERLDRLAAMLWRMTH